MISICVATYNGEEFIDKQLASFLNQTRRAEEVILCDDGSSDGTVGIIENFICNNHLCDYWKLYRNSNNKGYPDNFYYAMSLCHGDIVFLADQDDIWDKKKLERMIKVFEEHQEAQVVSCKFKIIDADGKSINTIMGAAAGREVNLVRSITIEEVFYKYEWPGMVMAYRNDWYKKWGIQLQNDCGIPHDFLICAKAAEENAFLQLNEELAWHRRHNKNVGKEEHRITKLLNRQRKLKEIEDYLEILQRLSEKQVLRTTTGNVVLEQKRVSMKGRYDALQSRKINKVLRNAWNNRKHTRLATLICDLIITKQ